MVLEHTTRILVCEPRLRLSAGTHGEELLIASMHEMAPFLEVPILKVQQCYEMTHSKYRAYISVTSPGLTHHLW